jgi:polyphenol oxidase
MRADEEDVTPGTTPPDVSDPFVWTDEPWGAALRCRALPAATGHLFTTRQLELSSEADMRQAAAAAGADRAVPLTQVHGRGVVVIRRGRPVPESRPEGDILVSDRPDVAVMVRAADCVPLLLADSVRGVVAAVHAGWRGTAVRAAVAAVDALAGEFGSRPADLTVAIGPSIGVCCYEVGAELVDAFAAEGHERTLIERWFVSPPPPRGTRRRSPLFLDLATANRDQLRLAGVPDERIHTAGLCTAMHLEVLTSYRVERERAGRIAGLIRAAAA